MTTDLLDQIQLQTGGHAAAENQVCFNEHAYTAGIAAARVVYGEPPPDFVRPRGVIGEGVVVDFPHNGNGGR